MVLLIYILLEAVILGKKNPKRKASKVNLKTLMDLPYTSLETLPAYSIDTSTTSIYSYYYPFNITKYK